MVKKLLFIFFLVFSTAVFSQKTLQKLSAAPNPFKEKTSIKFESTKDQEIILIIKNMLGKSVFSKKHSIKKGDNSIPFSRNNLQAGMYIYLIQGPSDLVSKRFVIK
ncbi:hypothetical protein GCM10011416_19840 [Polaribacter pacificus]|uniref:Secretion system C-terminal sorting domain-containing protein n=1 Tax=Polaribacter pacificus TaxID=1775173 RepID=A0A917MES0_9FLAO|nr:T9SS type A sorting domain-containing protein [Polaribacter pacificus]GGH01186.1 hypothetical protein GCM10011416_19840 [Polaribacter pacificus]